MNKQKRNKIFQFLLLGLSLGAILLLAGGLPNLHFQPGKPLHLLDWFLAQLVPKNSVDLPVINSTPGEVPIGPNLWDKLSKGTQILIIGVFWLMLAFSIIYAIISPQFRRELIRLFMILLVFMLVLPYIAQRLAQRPQTVGAEETPGMGAFGDTFFPEPPPFIQQPPGWLLVLAKIVLLVLLIGWLYWMWRHLRPKPDAKAVVIKNVRQALSDLESGSEWKNVVIACYSKMCQELQKTKGVRRHQAMTPREFENHLANAGITSAHIRELTLLFEGVRYGAKPADTTTQRKAIQSLRAILQTYGE
jgi:hypothetical protein